MAAQRKYELTGLTRALDSGETLHQIRAIAEIRGHRWAPAVAVGEVGGWIESTAVTGNDGSKRERLSGDAWVADNGCVYGDAWLEGRARVFDDAHCSGSASVRDDARVSENARLSGNALVWEKAWLSGNATVSGGASVYGHAFVSGHARVEGETHVEGTAKVTDHALITEDSHIADGARILGHAEISGDARVGDGAEIGGYAVVSGLSDLGGLGKVSGSARVDGEVYIDGRYNITGSALIEADRDLVIARPLGPRDTFAAAYRTTSGLAQVDHFFEGPWQGTIAEFAEATDAAIARWDASAAVKRLWRSEYAAFLQLAAAAETGWSSAR